MATLWTFGDSHTAGYGCSPGWEYYDNYKKEGDDIWANHLSNYLKLNLQNKGENGCSNESIVDEIINNWDHILPDDIVIIGKTYGTRFDVPNPIKTSDKKWITIFPSWIDWIKNDKSQKNIKNVITEKQFNSLENYIVDWRLDVLYDKRYMNIFTNYGKILEKKNVSVILWEYEKNKPETFNQIKHATNNKIEDDHMSFKGHLEFTEWMKTLVEESRQNNNKIIYRFKEIKNNFL